MTLNKLYYGKNNPSTFSKIATNSFIILILLSCYGATFSTLVMNETFFLVLKIFFMIIYITLLSYFLFNRAAKERLEKNLQQRQKPYFSIRTMHYATSLISPIIFSYLLCFSVYGFADAYTNALGQNYANSAALKKVYQRREKCDYFLEGDFFSRTRSINICITPLTYNILPARTFKANIYGKESMFGVTISKWSPKESLEFNVEIYESGLGVQ